MGKRAVSILLLAAMSLCLCGCGSVFEKEYTAVEDYVPAAPQEVFSGDKITVKNFSSLKQAIQRFVTDGITEGSIIFDSGYSGNVSEDLAAACWQIRTQNALCAYCVESISYELNRIVTNDEAEIRISYVDFGGTMDGIVRLTFSSGIEELILDALNEGKNRLAVYVSNGVYTAEGMEDLVLSVYRSHPLCTPAVPKTNVNVYSGTGLQRLYELNISYGMGEEELNQCRAEIGELDPFAEADTENMNEGSKALAACTYLLEHSLLSDSAADNSAYCVLVGGAGNSEGLALAYVELCHRLGLDCKVVYGLREWESHCWNIVTVDGERYHVDVSACMENWIGSGFLLTDQKMWGVYRWDIASYESCGGTLTYAAVAGIPEEAVNPPETPGNETFPEGETDSDTPEGESEAKPALH